MRPGTIGFSALAAVLLGCSGNASSPDAPASVPEAAAGDNPLAIQLPHFEVTPPPDVPRCACEGLSSSSPGSPETVSCQAAPSYCAECPVPFHEPRSCTTVGLHCDYPEMACDCQAADAGMAVWACTAFP